MSLCFLECNDPATTTVSKLDWTNDSDIKSVLETHAGVDCVIATGIVDDHMQCLEYIITIHVFIIVLLCCSHEYY